MGETCPDPVDSSVKMNALIAAARVAPDEGAGRIVPGEMWKIVPNAEAQSVLDFEVGVEKGR